MNDFEFFEDNDSIDFALLDSDPEADNCRFRELVARCDASRDMDVYIRQSQISAPGKHDSYLSDQKQIPYALQECGIPSTKIRTLKADINKSGALPIRFRADLAGVKDRIDKKITGTVISSDIARLFRDRSLKGPTLFISLCEFRSVKILTCIDDRWELLDMTENHDRGVFLQQCIMAAAERLAIKSRLGKGRLRMLRDNHLAWSGGPISVGYAVTQRQRLSNSNYTRRELYIYEPHAAVVKQVIRASLRSELISWPQFRDYCWKNGIIVPPFLEEIRADVGPKSVLYNKGRADMDSPHKLTTRNLKTILSNVLLLGDRLYGSGRSAKHTLKIVREIEEAEGQSLDCKVREHRLPLDNESVPELAILKTQEEHEMFWAATQKWLPHDLHANREAHYSFHPNQQPLNEKQSAGKARSGQSAGGIRKNPWAGYVFCYKHGVGEDGWPIRTHPLQFRDGDCICYKDHREGGYHEFCSTWGAKLGLASVLTNLLFARISQWLASGHHFLGDIVEERDAVKRQVEYLRQSLIAVKKKRDAAMRAYGDLTERMAGMEPALVESQLADYFASSVRPAVLVVQDMERELADAERAILATADVANEEELRAELRKMVYARDLPADKIRSLIELFVSEVGVITHGHWTEAVVIVRWRDRRSVSQKRDDETLNWLPESHDLLLCWRNWNRDDRKWTPEEDAVLRRLWPASSGASYEEIKAALLPGRKWNSLYRRVFDLKLTDGSRARQWQIAAQKSERTLAYHNPDLGFMLLQVGEGWPDLMGWAVSEEGVAEVLWAIACGHDGDLLADSVECCTRFPLGRGWNLPTWTEERLKIVLSGVGYAPTYHPRLNTLRSPWVFGV